MKKLEKLDQNDRSHGFYYASFHAEPDGSIVTNACPEDEEEWGAEGYTVYEINPDGTVIALSDCDEAFALWLTLHLINKNLSEESLRECIADISLQVASAKFISIDSRIVISFIIKWAIEFEKEHENDDWGVNTELDYLEAIEQFTDIKIRDAVDRELGYIDND